MTDPSSSINFSVNDGVATFSREKAESASFDYEGRLISCTKNGNTYRRTIANTFYRIRTNGDKGSIESVSSQEANSILEFSYGLASTAVRAGNIASNVDIAGRVASRNPQWAEADSKALLSLYSAVPVVPPDQPAALYLEVTSGCRWNMCTLCRGYETREYTTRSMGEFISHLKAVKDGYGAGISSRRSVFLGDVNALDIDQKMLLEVLDRIREDINLPVFTAFDIFTTPKKKNMINYRDLKDHGLNRVYVFLESGSYRVIRLFNKHINVTETMNLVNNIKDHGIGVTIVVMAGIGGKKYSRDHVEATANIISQLALDKDDAIVLTPIIESEDSNYMEISRNDGLSDMTMQEKYGQMDDITRSIREAYREVNGRDMDYPVLKNDLRLASL
ncbi:MAG: radical SAM protein [Thermoplasmataceae archaeon]